MSCRPKSDRPRSTITPPDHIHYEPVARFPPASNPFVLADLLHILPRPRILTRESEAKAPNSAGLVVGRGDSARLCPGGALVSQLDLLCTYTFIVVSLSKVDVVAHCLQVVLWHLASLVYTMCD